MKLNVTCAGCEVFVEEIDGQCVVSATKDGETVEEFTIDCEESEESEDLEDDIEEIEDEDDEDDEISESVKSFDKFFKGETSKK